MNYYPKLVWSPYLKPEIKISNLGKCKKGKTLPRNGIFFIYIVSKVVRNSKEFQSPYTILPQLRADLISGLSRTGQTR